MELSPPKSKCVLSEGRSLYSCIHTRTGALLKERRTGENGAGSAQKVNTVDRWRKLLFDTGPANSLQYIWTRLLFCGGFLYDFASFITKSPTQIMYFTGSDPGVKLKGFSGHSWFTYPSILLSPLSSVVIMFHWANLDVLGRVNLEVVFLTNGGELFIALYGLIYL